MNEAQAHEAIAQHFRSGFLALRPAVLLTFTNEILDAADEWVRLTIAPALSQQSALGAVKRWTRSGTIGVGCFTPANAGTQRASQFADDARTVLEGQFIYRTGDPDPVIVLGGSSGTPVSDGKWLYTLVTFAYSFDEHR